MKKAISILIVGIILLSLFSVISVSAESNESTTPSERVIETVDPNEVISDDYIYLPLSEDTAAIAEYLGNEKQVTIPSEIDGYKIVKIGYGAFICKSIKEVVIPEGVTEIEEDAFYACHSLLTVTFPETLVTIGERAFRGTNLHSVTVPDSVERIGSGAIVGRYLSDVKIGKGIKTIERNAIYGLYTSATITGYINTVAFDYARSHDMKFISLGNASELVERNYLYSVLSETEAEITEYLDSKPKITIPSEIDGYKIVGIGNSAFEGNDTITDVVISEGVTKVDSYAFSACKNLNSITLPETLVKIGTRAFASTALQNVTIPDSVETIGDRAFQNCPNLANVKIGMGINSIGILAIEKTDIITITGYDNTDAYDYAKCLGIEFISLGDAPNRPTRPEEPTTEPTEPTTEVTEPTTEPSQPTTSVTEPTEPTTTPEVTAKKANKMTVTVNTKTVKAKKLKNAKVTVKAITVKNNNGAVSYKKIAKNSSNRLSINTKTGKITVKKGTKKGTYKIKVKITAKGTKNYKPKTVTKTVKIKVT